MKTFIKNPAKAVNSNIIPEIIEEKPKKDKNLLNNND
jgi:hypothetical protein